MPNCLDIINELDDKIRCSTNIGIFISGGFDSSTVAYTVLYIIKTKLYEKNVVFYCVPRFDDSVLHATRITKWFNKEFPDIQFNFKLVGNPELHNSQQVRSGILSALHEIDLLILGDTKLPDNYLATLPHAPKRITALNKKIFQPLIQYDKRTAILLAQHLCILDHITTLSHSCTESKTIRCGKCWQCMERAWSFSDLNIVDTGTM